MGFAFLFRLLMIGAIIYFIQRQLRRWLGGQAAPKKADDNKATAETLTQCPVCDKYVTADAGRCERAGCPQLLVPVVFLLGLLVASPAHADGGGRYLAEVSGSNVAVVLQVNEITVARWQFGKADSTGVSINHWLRQGNNKIALRAEKATASSRLQARVYFSGLNAAGGLQQVNLMNAADIAAVGGEGLTVNFNLPSAPALALWTTTASDATAEQAGVLVNRLRQEMLTLAAAGQPGEAAAVLQLEQQDMARAYGAATADMALTASAVPAAELMISPQVVPAELSLLPVAGSNGLMRVARKDGAPLLLLQRNGVGLLQVMAVLIGQSGGQLQILRRVF